MTDRIKVGILVFNEVEVLDFAGPFEVFSITENEGKKTFNVVLIGEKSGPISARNNFKVIPNKSFDDNFELDILIIPGGYGAEKIEIKNKKVLNWIKEKSKTVEILASVCTGAMLLAECGLLNCKKATTHWMDLDKLEKEYPKIEVIRNTKFVDQGNILTLAGVSAGIDISFHIVKRILGSRIARNTAKRMEYEIEL